MSAARSRPRTAPAARPARRSGGVRPVLGLTLAAVLGAHLWVIDAWSLPVATDGSAKPVPTRITALPAPEVPRPVATPEPAPAPVPVPAIHRVAAPAKPHHRPTQPVAAIAPTTPSASARSAEPAEDRVEPAPVEASPEAAADPAPRLLALATPGSSATRPAPAAAASTALTTPPSVHLHYRMKKGALSGSGQIDWLRDGSTYRMRLEARVPVFGQIFLETSEGRIDASGLAPLRHTESRLRRSERAVSFVRDQGPPRILFSAREGDEPLRAGAQDRLSWIAQLATRMASPPGGEWRPGSSLAMDVASTGGDVQRWVFTIEGQDASGLWHLRREPDGPRDTRAEVWIDARQQHWPVRIQIIESSGEPLELTLDGLQPT
ncbi:DUF3108 domain-containing protein [uncultured Sphaerotilus sp.]|uniref:DUF3108 domain-containing protein n=1 Tax=uncultured Sphaerotilus sp. TaxID=474984 RepID=UPI0030CA4DE8